MNKIKQIWDNRWVRFSVVGVIYVLWFVIWTANPWWLLGLVVVYDYFISRVMDRLFLDRYRRFKNSNKWLRKSLEWVEALLFAVVVVVPLKLYFFGMYMIPTPSMENTLLVGDYLFVNKLEYGPRMANTPLSFPFVQHTMPLTKQTPSFVDWVQYPYKRLKGFSDIERNDVVVFNFPAGDTVALIEPEVTYYELLRVMGRQELEKRSEIIFRPVDKRENYIKRCVAVAGDSLRVVQGKVYINGEPQVQIPGLQFTYFVQVESGARLAPSYLEELGVSLSEVSLENQVYQMPLTEAAEVALSKNPKVVRMVRGVSQGVSEAVFPQRPDLYPWNEDNYGPIWIPGKGKSVALNIKTLPLYSRIIKNYEGNTLEVAADSTILINNIPTTEYTFKMDYYFMMGDNRHNSADSRYWGFVPMDHIEGKASFIWLSITPGKSLFGGIRWNRMFDKIQ